MKRDRVVKLIGLFLFTLAPSWVFAGGFAINEIDTKALGMGGAFAAQADNPSAVYFNPAGIVQLEGWQVSTGFATISPGATFKNAAAGGVQTDMKNNTFFVPNLFITYQLNDRWSFGLGSFSNFGLGTDWPDDWPGRFLIGGTNAEVETLSINPVIAFRPFDKLSIAAGVVAQYLDITLQSKVGNVLNLPEGSLELDATKDWDYGYNLGLLFWITEELRFGASYRSRIKHSINDGDMSISGLTGPFAAQNTDTTASAELELPAIAYLGLAWTKGPWTLEFDFHWTEWSTYDELRVDFDSKVLNQDFISKTKDWSDVWAYRFGVEYSINEMFDVRGGVIFDDSPIPDQYADTLLPSGDRWLYCIGGSWHYKNFTLDLAYNYLDDEKRVLSQAGGEYNLLAPIPPTVTLKGSFEDVDAHIFMINASYAF